MEDTLCCPICKDQISDPRVIPCGHSFCLMCIKNFCERKVCPMCNCPFKSADDLPKNWIILQLIEEKQERKNTKNISQPSSNNQVCENCDPSNCKESMFWCEDCQSYLCDECFDTIHTSIRVNRYHKKVQLNQMHQVLPKCQKHPNMVLDYYCQDDNSLICCKCALNNNKKVVGVDEYLEKIRIKLRLKVDSEPAMIKLYKSNKLLVEQNIKIDKLVLKLQEMLEDLLDEKEQNDYKLVSIEEAKTMITAKKSDFLDSIDNLGAGDVVKEGDKLLEKNIDEFTDNLSQIIENICLVSFEKYRKISKIINENLQDNEEPAHDHIFEKIEYEELTDESSESDEHTDENMDDPSLKLNSLNDNCLLQYKGCIGNFSEPIGITVSQSGLIAVTDRKNRKIQVLNADGSHYYDIDNKFIRSLTFMNIRGITTDNEGNFIVADAGNSKIKIIDVVEKTEKTISGNFRNINDVAFDRLNKKIYAVDVCNDRIVVCQNNTLVQIIGGSGDQDGQFNQPTNIAFDNRTGRIIVTDSKNNRVQVFGRRGKFILKFGSRGNDIGQFLSPKGVAVDEESNIIVCDSGNHRIQMFDQKGNFKQVKHLEGKCEGVAVTSNGYILVTDVKNCNIQVFHEEI